MSSQAITKHTQKSAKISSSIQEDVKQTQQGYRLPKRFWEDDKWALEHYMELQDRYVDKWVAVCNKRVIAVAEGPIDARRKAQEKTGIKEIPVIFVESGQNIYQN